jgi:hypothetical protein
VCKTASATRSLLVFILFYFFYFIYLHVYTLGTGGASTLDAGLTRVEKSRSIISRADCSFGLSVTGQQYFSLRTNQPPAISQQYFSLRTNQHQPSATSQTNRLAWCTSRDKLWPVAKKKWRVHTLFAPLDFCTSHLTICLI